MSKTRHSKKRTKIVTRLMESLMNSEIYETIDYRRLDESRIKQYMHRIILDEVTKMISEFDNISENTAKEKSRKNLYWEGDKKTTVNNMLFFGTQHRPDFVLNYNDLRIAVEVKKGENGSSLREGIGQGIVYTTNYDFCVYLFIDTSKEKKILNSFGSEKETEMIDSLWKNHNVMFYVI